MSKAAESTISQMDDRQVQLFALRQARSARATLRLTAEETLRYQQAVMDAIEYFNRRDEAHAEYMHYLDEVRVARQSDKR